jgi:hypothetical protein
MKISETFTANPENPENPENLENLSNLPNPVNPQNLSNLSLHVRALLLRLARCRCRW